MVKVWIVIHGLNMRFALPSPRHLQNPLVRILASVVALAVLATVVIFGALAMAILVVGGLLWYAWFRWRVYRARKQPGGRKPDPHGSDQHGSDPDVIEGEYVVIDEHPHTRD